MHRLLGAHVIDAGLLPRDAFERFGRLQQRRSVADYKATEDVDVGEATGLVEDARAFVGAVSAVLEGLP